MENTETNNESQQEPPQNIEPTPPVANHVEPTIDPPIINQSETLAYGCECNCNTNEIKNISEEIKNFSTFYINKKHKTHWLEYGNFGIGILAIGLTALLWIQGNKLVDSAERSANEADSSANYANEAVRKADIANGIAKDQYAIADKSLSHTINTDSISLQAQIQSLRETQKQFQIENRPYLQINEFSFDAISPNNTPYLTFYISNLGGYPAKVLKSKSNFIVSEQDKRTYDINNPPSIGNPIGKEMNTYIVRGTPQKEFAGYGESTNYILSEEKYNDLMNGKLFIYLVGRIIYQNLSDATKKMRYDYLIECNVRTNGVVYKYNENIDYK